MALTANEQIYNKLLKHDVYIQQVANFLGNEVVKELDATNANLRKAIENADSLTTLKAGTAKFNKQLSTLKKKIFAERKKAATKGQQKYVDQLEQLLRSDLEIVGDSIVSSIPGEIKLKGLTTTTLHSIIAQPTAGYELKNWFKKFLAQDADRIYSRVLVGIDNNLTMAEITRDVFGTRASGYTDGVVNASRHEVIRFARTVQTGMVNKARKQFYQANNDIVSQVMYTATLDGRTTAQCLFYHGKLFDVNDPNIPTPPLHHNCRSTLVPVVDAIGIIGKQPTIAGRNFRKQAKATYINKWKSKGESDAAARKRWNNLTSGTKNKLQNAEIKKWGDDVIGKVPADTKGTDWFKQQSATFQDDVLGPTRGALYRKYDLSFDEILDSNRQRMLSVEKLTEKYGMSA